MKKKKNIVIITIAALLVVGVLFGITKVNGTLIEGLTGDEGQDPGMLTWFAADLPGAEQVYMYTFNDGRVDVPGIVLDGTFENKNGYLEVSGFGDLILYNLLDTDLLDNPADVVVYDFDIWHPYGIPSTTFDNGYVVFTDRYYTDFSESGGVGEPVYSFCVNCENFPGNGSFDQCVCILGDDTTEKVHMTVLNYGYCSIYYVNGVYLYEDAYAGTCLTINLSSWANLFDESEEGLAKVCIDNIECVRFGDGTGSYNGVLMDYKTNTSLKISDLLEVN